MAYKIFLSHSGSDKNWINLIVLAAKSAGIMVYLYEHDIRPGIPIADKIKQSIRQSDAMVVLLTNNSQFSPYVQQEIGFAEAHNKPIIPLVQPGIADQCLAMLTGREYIAFDFNEPLKSLSKLVNYLNQLKKRKETGEAIAAIALIALLGWAIKEMTKK